jgi:tetratricopeptide (TPR) repeat protein
MPNLPRDYHLRRAVQSYEQAGDYRAAAEVLTAFGTPAASAEAARRLLILDDLPAAGAAFLAAGQPRAALECFRRARLPARELACLQALGDDAAVGALLLEQGRLAEAVAPLERALAAVGQDERARRATLCLQLARALGEPVGQPHYRAGLSLLATLPATPESAAAWLAMAAWGEAIGRQDRTQEGYAQALRLLEQAGDTAGRRAVAARYRAAAERMGNRSLARRISDEG